MNITNCHPRMGRGLAWPGRPGWLRLLLVIGFVAGGGAARLAYADPGDLDLTFKGDGKVVTDFDDGRDTLEALAIQPNGKIVAAGTVQIAGLDKFGVARYNADGTLDPAFGGNGRVAVGFRTPGFPDLYTGTAYALLVQPDGRIVLAGRAHADDGYLFGVARLNPDGTLDSSFSNDGKLTFGFDTSSQAYALALQADGKIIVAGGTYDSNSNDGNFAVARLNPNGTLDPSFGTNGKVTTGFGGREDAYAVAVQANGKIVVAGERDGGNPADYDFAVARYNPNGTLDTSFAGNGKLLTGFGGDESARAVAIQPSGKIVVAGVGTGGCALARYTPTGTLDPAFGSAGRVTTAFAHVCTMILQGDGKIVTAGSESGDFALARYNADGSLDPTFSGDGMLTTSFGANVYANALALQADGKIVAGGYRVTYVNYPDPIEETFDFALARYNIP